MALVSKTFSQIITFTRASSATYFDATGTLQTATTNTPRFDYNPSTLAAQGLLIEESRTNLLTYSEDFDDPAWTPSGVTVSANAGLAPDGNTTADKVIPTATATNFKELQQNQSVTSGVTYTFSHYVKADGYTFVQLVGTGAIFGTFAVNYDLSIGQETAFGAGTSTVIGRGISPIGNGWYRIYVSVTALGTSASARMAVNIIPAANSGRGVTWTGDGTSGVLFWGAQLEAGSFPTSYIPTVASTVTRAADQAIVNTLSPWYNAAEGTLYAEAQWFGLTVNDYYMAFNDGTANNLLGLGITSGGSFRFIAIAGGSTEASIISGTATINTTFKHAGAYKLNNYAATANGASPNQDTTANVPSGISSMSLNSSIGTTNQLNGYLRRIAYYPRRLSNAELQAITS